MKQNLIEYFDSLVKEDKEVKIVWEGGNDSGSVMIYVDDRQIYENNHPQIETFLNHVYDHLDYGSWAGNFNASGEAIYDSDLKSFRGTDNYSEEDTRIHSCKILIQIPDELWFDDILINIDGHDYASVNSDFYVINGFISNDHNKFLKILDKEITDKINDEIEIFQNNHDYVGISTDIELKYSDFKKKDGYREHIIDKLEMTVENTDEKEICIDLNEINFNEK